MNITNAAIAAAEQSWVPIVPVYPAKNTLVEVKLANGKISKARYRNFRYGENWEHENGLHFSLADSPVISWRTLK